MPPPPQPLVPVILSGGAGARLWPVSRELHPKPFIRLADGQSLLQKAFLRAVALPGVRQVVTVTNSELFLKTRSEYAELPEAAAIATTFVLEPAGRNTAAAIAAAALVVQQQHGGDALMLVLAADQLVTRHDAFAHAVAQAVPLAAAGRLVTFGIRPESPATGYGYIEASGNDVQRFVEKPALAQATEYLASGRYLWNAGIFCLRADAILAEMARHCPAIMGAVRACAAASPMRDAPGAKVQSLDAATFAAVPAQSIDYAVMEKSSRVAVVPCDIGWSDIGSWDALAGLDAADGDGNRLRGDTVLHASRNCTIHADGRLVGAVGVQDLTIIDTPDALLVAHTGSTQDVKDLFVELKARGHEAHRLHRTVHRPWGTWTVLEEGPGFKIKRIEVQPGESLSLQSHAHRSEHWVVVRGTARVVNGERELTIATNESTFIPAGHRHRLSNAGDVPCVIIEVQTGAYVGEDDIVRHEDQYDRA